MLTANNVHTLQEHGSVSGSTHFLCSDASEVKPQPMFLNPRPYALSTSFILRPASHKLFHPTSRSLDPNYQCQDDRRRLIDIIQQPPPSVALSLNPKTPRALNPNSSTLFPNPQPLQKKLQVGAYLPASNHGHPDVIIHTLSFSSSSIEPFSTDQARDALDAVRPGGLILLAAPSIVPPTCAGCQEAGRNTRRSVWGSLQV